MGIDNQRRFSEPTEESNLYSLVTHLLSIPRVPTDAVLVLRGQGEEWRVIDGIRARKQMGARLLLLSPINEDELSLYQRTLAELQLPPYGLSNTDGVIIGGLGAHTRSQAEWFYDQVQEQSIKSASVHASPYHIVRAYLTVLKYLLEKNCFIPLVPVPTSVSPYRMVPAQRMDSWTLIHGELERVKKYQNMGHVATLGELQEYLTWLWKQPLLRDVSAEIAL